MEIRKQIKALMQSFKEGSKQKKRDISRLPSLRLCKQIAFISQQTFFVTKKKKKNDEKVLIKARFSPTKPFYLRCLCFRRGGGRPSWEGGLREWITHQQMTAGLMVTGFYL